MDTESIFNLDPSEISSAFHGAGRIGPAMRGAGIDGQDINDEGIMFEKRKIYHVSTYDIRKKGMGYALALYRALQLQYEFCGTSNSFLFFLKSTKP